MRGSPSSCLCFLPCPASVVFSHFRRKAVKGNPDFAEAGGAVTHFPREQGTAESLRGALHWTRVITEWRIQQFSAAPQPVPNKACSTFQEGDCRRPRFRLLYSIFKTSAIFERGKLIRESLPSHGKWLSRLGVQSLP